MNKFFITNAIPYVNARPHVGHALEFVQSDVIARYHRIIGDETLLLCGGDENALKNVQAAEEAGIPVQKFIDNNTEAFYKLSKKLDVQFDVWQKGSDRQTHYVSSQKLWELCDKSGDIYKKSYKGLYCVGCEAFYTTEELNENGECFEHPGKKLEEVEEENYFFKLSKYQNTLLRLIGEDEYKIIPEFRKNEMLSLIKSGLKDFSISRSSVRAKNWGVPVPGDESQRMYVWFDALNIYQSGIGFGLDEKDYKKWWPADLHVIGKGIIRFHAIYWPAILLSAGLELPKSLFVHEYFTVNGQKMSKTLGNVIDPVKLIDEYGADALRYYFLAKFSPFSDGDFSEDKFKEVYNADLANGLGNLIARVAKLCEKVGFETKNETKISDEVLKQIEFFHFNEALSFVWEQISTIDKKINLDEPWKLSDTELKKTLGEYVNIIQKIGINLAPFLPNTSEEIKKRFSGKIKSSEPLFPRLS
jgi:methionyl-tRNA synthetase